MPAAAVNTNRYARTGSAYPIPVKPAADAAGAAVQAATLAAVARPLHRAVPAGRRQREQA